MSKSVLGNNERRNCKPCLKKDPPVETPLIIGVNITEYRMTHKDYVCNECVTIRQKKYKEEKYAAIKEQKHIEAIEKITKMWNDPYLKGKMEISDRVYMMFNKNDIREPSKGYKRNWICEAIFPDYWHIDANGVADKYLEEQTNMTPMEKRIVKPHIVRFVSCNLEQYVLAYRQKAKMKWDGIVDAILRKYFGKDKIVATPKYTDPDTKEQLANWYLLSYEPERKEREEIRESKKTQFDFHTDEEKTLIKRRQETEELEKAKKKDGLDKKDTKDSDSTNKSNDDPDQGGE